MAVLGLRFCARVFSSCGKRGPLFIVVRGPLLLRSTGSMSAGSAIVAHGPSHSAACGIFPDQGSNPCPLHWQADSQPLRRQGSPLFLIYRWKHLWLREVMELNQGHTASSAAEPELEAIIHWLSISLSSLPEFAKEWFLPSPHLQSGWRGTLLAPCPVVLLWSISRLSIKNVYFMLYMKPFKFHLNARGI